LGLLFATLFVAADIAYNDVPAPPLDDTFIHFQYAKQLARGFFFRYHDGDPVSTGATSFLYPVLLAPFWAVGLRGVKLIWAAHLLNFLGLLASMTFVYAALRRLMPNDRLLAWLGGLFVAANGWFLWGVTSGMAIGVTSCALSAMLYSLVLYVQQGEGPLGGGKMWPLAVSLAFLSASRPEGLVISYAVVFSLWCYAFYQQAAAPSSEARPLRKWAKTFGGGFAKLGWPIWAGLAAGTLPTIVMIFASGHMTTNGMLVKSHFAIDMDWVRYLWETGRTIAAVPARLLWAPTGVVHGIMIAGVTAGLAAAIRSSRAKKGGAAENEKSGGNARVSTAPIGFALIAAFAAIICFYGFLMEHIEHHNRYYMPYVPLVVLTIFIGLEALSRPFTSRLGVVLRRVGGAVLIVVGVGSVGEWARIYAHNCGDIAKTYLPMARWMRNNIPEGVTVAVHDAGALPYLGGRKTYDIIGLVSNEFRVPGGSRSDAFAWETMERLKPGYMIIYPRFFPRLSRLPVFRKVHSVRIPRVTIAGGKEKVAYEIRWDRLAKGSRPHSLPPAYSDWKVVDTLDPPEAESEERHDYSVDHGRFRGAARFRLEVFRHSSKLLIDGARVHSGGEEFRARNVDPKKPLAVGMRSRFRSSGVLEVRVDGERAGYWDTGHGEHRRGSEAYFEIPAELLHTNTPRIEIRPTEATSAVVSYHYFFLQPG
jgi:hypothetical protein